MTAMVFARRMMLLLAVSVMGLLIAAGCGSDDDNDGVGTSSSETSVTSSSATTGATTSSSSDVGPSRDTSATSAAARPTVTDLEQALAAEIEASSPLGPGVVDCEASGELTDWQPVVCFFLPNDPAEFGGIHVSMLDGGDYAWALGECCAAAPWPDDYPPGLFCRDLAQPPPGSEPDRYLSTSDHLTCIKFGCLRPASAPPANARSKLKKAGAKPRPFCCRMILRADKNQHHTDNLLKICANLCNLDT